MNNEFQQMWAEIKKLWNYALKLNNYISYTPYTLKWFATVDLNDTACAIANALLTQLLLLLLHSVILEWVLAKAN